MGFKRKFWQYIGTHIARSFDEPPVEGGEEVLEAQETGHQGEGNPGESPEVQGEPGPQMSAADVARELLAAIGCTCQWSDEDEDVQACDVLFQGGHFLLRTWKRHPYALLTFPFFFSTSVDELDMVRSVANRCNMESILTRVVTSQDEAKNELHCHVMAYVSLDAVSAASKQNMANIMAACFGVRRDFEKYMEEARAEGYDDPELELHNRRRDAFLLSEQAWTHHSEHVRVTPGEGGVTFNLKEMLRRMYDWNDITGIAMRIVTDDKLEAVDDACGYMPMSALVGEGGEIITDEATLLLDVRRESLSFKNEEIGAGISGRVRVVVLLNVTSADDKSVYAQVTLTREPAKPGDLRIATHPDAQSDSVSFMIAQDLTSEADRRAEYEYMLNDAHDKSEQGREQELTDVQRYLLVNEQAVGDGFNLYWGYYYARRKRYLEALPHFENIYGRLREQQATMKRAQRANMLDLMYNIGMCHARLGHNERAFFFLDAAAQSGNTEHVIELVNMLVNTRDVRAEFVLNNVMNNVQEQMNDMNDTDEGDEAGSEAMQGFMRFMEMRRAYLYIEMRRWRDAERILKELMKDESTREFAINELAYIGTKKGL